MQIAESINANELENLASELKRIRDQQEPLFVIGLGGSAANASHATNDFRKLCGIDARCPTDNIAEFSAWANDSGWEHAFDSIYGNLFILSVGGGTDSVSTPITSLLRRTMGLVKVLGIVGPDGGETFKLGLNVIRIPCSGQRVTPHTEAFQAVIWHALVCHPLLQRNKTKW
jgi:D-sedoheptulose 7-phosphate isomerase